MESPTLESFPVESLTVADIMRSPVRTVRPEGSVGELVRSLTAERISGMPVVEADGSIVGVVSASDVIRLLCAEDEIPAGDPLLAAPTADRPGSTDPDPQDLLESYFVAAGDRLPPLQDEGPRGSLLAETRVADIMTAATFTISPTASLRELASFMTRGGIHRALVVDGGALLGIVTTVDIVRAVAGDFDQRGTG